MLPVKNVHATTNATSDLLVVKILNEHYRYDSFEYVIYSDNSAVIRKGSFRAPTVQLRTVGLKEGSYCIDLIYNGRKWKTNHFEKDDLNANEDTSKVKTVYFI